MQDPVSEDVARGRWMAINLLRFAVPQILARKWRSPLE